MTINRNGDSIAVIYKLDYYKEKSRPIIFGSFISSKLRSPKSGQSIAGVPTYFNDTIYYYYKYEGFYSIDNSPTIGELNDSIGMCGLIKGKIIAKNGKILKDLPSGSFELEIKKGETYLPLVLNPDGSYYINMVSIDADIDVVFYRYGNNQGDFVNISPIKISMQPDSFEYIDIYVQDSLKVSINEINQSSESILKIYPNPSKGLYINYEIMIPVKSSNCFLSIVNLNGQMIFKTSVNENKSKIYLPANIKNGIYNIILNVNNRSYLASKIQILK